jgi:hypothetical protein
MPVRPLDITREHVLDAVKEIEEKNIPLQPSTQWDVIIKGKAYPPKDIMRYAHKQKNGKIDTGDSRSPDTTYDLDSLGFLIRAKNERADKIRKIIREYKQSIDLSEFANQAEKWYFVQKYRDAVDPDNPDFVVTFGDIRFVNFAYRMAPNVIKEILQKEPIPYQQCLIRLFDETQDLNERIKTFIRDVEAIYRNMHPEHNNSSHHDERTIATLLTLRNPERYTFFMDTYYRNFCTLMGVKPIAEKGAKYAHYLKYIQEFASQYVNADKELIAMAHEAIPKDAYTDDNHLILAQDIVFRMLGKDSQYVTDNPVAITIGNSEEDFSTLVKKDANMIKPINLILYGPPGTGKTYNTILRAAQIVTGNPTLNSFTEAKHIFNQELHRRIEFITFHQNYSYEDFVQGLRPDVQNTGSLSFTKSDGVFMNNPMT